MKLAESVHRSAPRSAQHALHGICTCSGVMYADAQSVLSERDIMFGIATRVERLASYGRFLVDGRVFTWKERVGCVRGVKDHGVHDLLLRRLRRASDGAPYFDIAGKKIFFRPDVPIADEAEVLLGALIIMREAFVDPPAFFSRQVSLREGDVVLDLGGNIGTSAIEFSKRVGPEGRVYSFEPVFHELLQRNLRENEIHNVTVIPRGVGATPGEAEFAITDRGIDSRMDPAGKGGIRRQIPITTVDEFVEQEGLDRVDFIKADIEGAEELALRGARRVIRQFRPKWSLASYHTDCGFGGDPQHAKLIRLLEEHGYSIREVGEEHIFAW